MTTDQTLAAALELLRSLYVPNDLTDAEMADVRLASFSIKAVLNVRAGRQFDDQWPPGESEDA